jgi:parallel beta-helix repeat protein
MKHILLLRWFIIVITGILVVTALFVSPVHANSGTLYVAPDGHCGGAKPCYSTIQDAVNAAVNGDEIRVATGTYSQVSTGKGITAVVRIVDKKITLTGGYTTANWNTSNPTANPTVIDPNDAGIGIYINYQADIGVGNIIVNGFSITNGNATDAGAGTDSGGGIYIDHTTHVHVTVQNCKIYENVAEDGNGGGIWSTRSDVLKIENNEVRDNDGSGVVVTYGDNTVIVGNVIKDNAGDGVEIISDLGGKTDVRNNEVTGNQGTGINLNTIIGGSLTNNISNDNHDTYGGGGLEVTGAINDFLISGNTFKGNSALQGGGIDISGSKAQITNNLIEGNFTTPTSNGGGGLYVNAGATGAYVLVFGNQIYSNTTTNQGGGMLILGEVDVTGNTITGNSAFSGGGMIATAKGKISNNLFSGNTAQSGGGLLTVNATELILERNQVIDNHATNGDGGGMKLWGGFYIDVFLDGNQVISNTASKKGGGIYLECPPNNEEPIDISNTVLADNLAATGSGLYSTVCELNLAYNTVSSNRDSWGDGIGFYLRDPAGSDAAYAIENTIMVKQTVGVYVESGTAALEATFWGSDTWANDADTGGAGTINLGTKSYQGDPSFVDPENDDYHITENSPVIDKGIDTWITTDMDAQSRSQGETDIGADEYGQLIMLYLPLVSR